MTNRGAGCSQEKKLSAGSEGWRCQRRFEREVAEVWKQGDQRT